VLYWGGMPGFYVFALLSTILVLVCSFNMFIYLSVITICIIIIYFFKTSPYLKIALMSIYIISGYAAPKVWNDVLKPHQRSRIMTLVDPTDKKGSGYQVHQGMIAIGSGGNFGKGFTKGTQVQLGLVPEVQTDFAICIFAEEFGYFGILIVLSLFSVLIMRLIFYASQTRNPFNSVMLLGTASIFLYHVFTNMGMTVGIMPVTGIPLPLVSYGGTFILTCMMMLGYCSNLIINRFEG
jgi:rod shape determining protein RodA